MQTQSKVLKWSLVIGIVIVLNMFFNYALSLVYKQPKYEVFCPNTSQVVTIPDTQKACVDKGGQWTNDTYYGKPVIMGEIQPKGYCDLQFTCRNNFEAKQKVYERNVFITLVLLGAICVAFGNFFFFSSRRRHTRLVSDWSSDVCSSDLMIRHTRLVSDWSSDVCSSD